MPIKSNKIDCNSCNQTIEVTWNIAWGNDGKVLKCPHCRQDYRVELDGYFCNESLKKSNYA